MIKNNLDYKLINIGILTLIFFILYQTSSLWVGIFKIIWSIIMPFLAAFTIAYALYPLLEFLKRKKVPKAIGVLIIVVVFFSILTLTGFLLAPVLFEQLISLFNGITAFFKDLSLKSDLDFGTIQSSLSSSFNNILSSIGKYVSDGAINFINVSIGVATTVFIIISVSIYFLSDMENIRNNIKKYLRKKSLRTYSYFKTVDKEMKSYLSGFAKIMLITLIEYTVVYFIIGHPNALLIGFLAVLGNFIPIFGGVIVNIIAAITAFSAGPDMSLFIKTCVAFIILSNIDGYIINPAIYGKTNRLHPIIVILSVFAGGILFGVVGIIVSLPVAIIIYATYKFYQQDIEDKIEDIKDNKKIKKPKKPRRPRNNV